MTTKPRFRFSITTLVLLTTIFGMGITIAMLWRELRPLRSEVSNLRADLGVLDLGDRDVVQAIAGKTYQQTAFRWRVWCPEGKRVWVCVMTDRIPEKGFPTARVRRELRRPDQGAEEMEVTLAAEKKLDGKVVWHLSADGITHHVLVPEEATDWLLTGASGWTGGPTYSTIGQIEDKPLILMRQRVFYDKSGQTPPPNPPELTDGLLVWIETKEAE